MKVEQPLVSVVVITYNQEDFIEETLINIVKQKVSFPIEVLVGDDCSKDSTREILKQFEKKYSFIRVLYHKNNLGLVNNFIQTISATKGKYIAICEGDDYWVDEDKLERQFNLLENKKDCSVCFHSCMITQNGKNFMPPTKIKKWSKDKELSLIDALNEGVGYTLSMMFRREVYDRLDKDLFRKYSLYDWILKFHCLLAGQGYFLKDRMGVYRRHELQQSLVLINKVSVYNIRKSFLNDLLASFEGDKFEKERTLIQDYLARLEFSMCRFFMKKFKPISALKHFYIFWNKSKNIKTNNIIWDAHLKTPVSRTLTAK